MAAHIVDSGNNLNRTTNIVSGASAFTVMFWALQTAGSASGTYPILTIANGTPGVNTYTKYVQFFNDAGNYQVEATPDGVNYGDIEYFIQGVTLGVWKHLCYTRSAAGFMNFYVNGLPVQPPVTQSMAGSGLNFVLLGDDGTGSGVTHQASNYREWSVALTQAQINAELASTASVVNATGLVAFTPLTTNGNDTSGNGNNWTATGTVTYVADPTFPANFCPNTATALVALPAMNTESLQVAAGTAASGFFSYASLASDVAISVFPFGVLSAFAPFAATYNPNGVNLNSGRGNVPIFFASEPAFVGQIYLIEAIPDGTLTTPTVVLKTARFAQMPAPPGSIAIPATATFSDGYPVPLTLLAAGSATVLSMALGFPSGGLGAAPGVGLANILNNGTLLVSIGSTGLQVYSAFYQLLGAATSPGNIQALGSDNLTTFYVCYTSGGHYKVQSVSQAGVLGSTIYDLGAISFVTSIGANASNTILYYKNGSTKVSKWDLVNNASLGDLITSVTFHTPMLVLQDNSIVFGNSTTTFGRYDGTSGSLLNTITNANSQNFAGSDVLATDVDATSFVQWQTNTGQQATVQYVSTGTGATVANVARTVFAGGTSSGAASATPVLYGPDPTCPVWVTRAQSLPVPLYIGTRKTYTMRRERTVALPVQPGNARQTLSRLEIQLQPGTGTPGSPLAESKLFAQISWDYGKTWSNSRLMNAGREGAYLTRPFLNILGAGRYPVVRVLTTDTFVPVMTDGFIWVTPGTH